MKPYRSILDESFRYVPAGASSVTETWRRFGWHPTTDEERKVRRSPTAQIVVEKIGVVTPIRRFPGPRPVSLHHHRVEKSVR